MYIQYNKYGSISVLLSFLINIVLNSKGWKCTGYYKWLNSMLSELTYTAFNIYLQVFILLEVLKVKESV